jgi:holin-like protein
MIVAKSLKTAVQVIFFILLAEVSDGIAALLHLPVSGSVVGILLLFGLLQLKLIRMEWIELGSKWLLAEMLLFFIPAAVGITNYKSLIIHSGIVIFLTILCSTILVMVLAGMLGERLVRGKREEAR